MSTVRLAAMLSPMMLCAFVAAAEPSADSEGKPPTYADVAYGSHPRQQLDFWQARTARPAPVLIVLHEGGFAAGSKSVNPILREHCLRRGISVAAVGYRFSKDAIAPAPFLDGARAVQFLRSKAEFWRIDRERIAAIGTSAGGGIALWVAFHEDLADPYALDRVRRESSRLVGVATNDAQTTYDLRVIRTLFPGSNTYRHPVLAQLFDVDPSRLDTLPADKEALFEEVSPITHLTTDDPPCFLNYTSTLEAPVDDQGPGLHHAKFGMLLFERANELSVPCELRTPAGTIGGDNSARAPLEFLVEILSAKAGSGGR